MVNRCEILSHVTRRTNKDPQVQTGAQLGSSADAPAQHAVGQVPSWPPQVMCFEHSSSLGHTSVTPASKGQDCRFVETGKGTAAGIPLRCPLCKTLFLKEPDRGGRLCCELSGNQEEPGSSDARITQPASSGDSLPVSSTHRIISPSSGEMLSLIENRFGNNKLKNR